MKEEWKDICGYEGIYKISNLGQVKNIIHNRILKPSIMSSGYFHLSLCKNKIKKYFRIHRLVALHFIDNPLNKKQVNHIDGNKLNNHINNLEWSTASENAIHAIRTKLWTHWDFNNQKGENNNLAKLSKEDVVQIRKLCNNKEMYQRDIAKIFNISESTISEIKNKHLWSHI